MRTSFIYIFHGHFIGCSENDIIDEGKTRKILKPK